MPKYLHCLHTKPQVKSTDTISYQQLTRCSQQASINTIKQYIKKSDGLIHHRQPRPMANGGTSQRRMWYDQHDYARVYEVPNAQA